MRFIFTIFLLLISQITQAEIRLKTLAQIYDVSITEHDLDDRIEVLAVLSNASVENFKAYREKILQEMIKDEIFLHQAKKLKIKIDEDEVEEAINQSEQGRGLAKDTIRELAKKHRAIYKTFKAQVAKNLLVQGYIAPKVMVTDEEVAKQMGKSRTTLKITIANLQLNKLETEANKATLELMPDRVKNCKEFEEFAIKYNLPQITVFDSKIEDLNDSLKSFVNTQPIGVLTDIVTVSDDIYQYLMVCDKQNIEIGKKSREEVHAEIYNKKIDDAVNNYYLSLIKNARIIVFDK